MSIEIQMNNCAWSVGDIEIMDGQGTPEAGKVVVFHDGESGITFAVPFSREKAHALAQALTATGIVPMKDMTPEEMARAAGGAG